MPSPGVRSGPTVPLGLCGSVKLLVDISWSSSCTPIVLLLKESRYTNVSGISLLAVRRIVCERSEQSSSSSQTTSIFLLASKEPRSAHIHRPPAIAANLFGHRGGGGVSRCCKGMPIIRLGRENRVAVGSVTATHLLKPESTIALGPAAHRAPWRVPIRIDDAAYDHTARPHAVSRIALGQIIELWTAAPAVFASAEGRVGCHQPGLAMLSCARNPSFTSNTPMK